MGNLWQNERANSIWGLDVALPNSFSLLMKMSSYIFKTSLLANCEVYLYLKSHHPTVLDVIFVVFVATLVKH